MTRMLQVNGPRFPARSCAACMLPATERVYREDQPLRRRSWKVGYVLSETALSTLASRPDSTNLRGEKVNTFRGFWLLAISHILRISESVDAPTLVNDGFSA